MSDAYKKLEELAYQTGMEVGMMYQEPVTVICSESYMAYIVIVQDQIVFAYRMGDRL